MPRPTGWPPSSRCCADVDGEFAGLASFDGVADVHPLNENAATISATKAIWAREIREKFMASSALGRRQAPFASKGTPCLIRSNWRGGN